MAGILGKTKTNKKEIVLKKINQKKEKVARNEVYSLKYQVESDNEDKKPKKKGPMDATWANWCRHFSHPSSCRCEFE